MIISLISILTMNRVIGRENLIPWYFSIDMYWFSYHTLDKPIIMGRKTFESIKKPLSGRLNIVLSSQLLLNKEKCKDIFIVKTPEAALSLIQKSNEVMVIGGSAVYNIFLPKCTRMYLTYIDHIYNYGDTWFPDYNQYEWRSIFNTCKVYKINNKLYYNLYFKILERY